jgi:anti-sigma factor RsiW
VSGKILPFDGAAHHPAQLLLPWFVNGTLDAAEAADVRAHLEQCPHCRTEVEALQGFQATYAESEPAPDPEPALARLHATIAAVSASPSPRPAQASRPSRTARPARRWMPSWLPALERVLPWAAFAGVAVLGSVVVLQSGTFDPSPRYRTLGAAPAAAPDVARVAVVFDPDVSEGRMRAIVQSVGARIVDGPTPTRAYVLETPRAGQRDVLSALRTANGVQLAEPLDFAP